MLMNDPADLDLRPKLIGARIKRTEDPRLLTGLGSFVDDRQVAGVLHAAFGRRRQDQLGPVSAHRGAPFDRQVVRHDQRHPEAAHRRDHRQCDPGVAAGCLDQPVARLDFAALLGAPDHRQRRAILDRAARIVALELGQQHVAPTGSGRPRQPLQPHQRRIADRRFDGRDVRHRGVGQAHVISSSSMRRGG